MNSAETSTIRRPFIEHVQEFRRRLVWSCLALLVGGSVGYYLYEWLLDLIQKPIGQTLYYTSPTGGFNFAFKICIVFGLVFALPVISYHIFKFLEPVSKKESRLSIVAFVLWSVDLAYAGMLFGYFVSLPAALHFLTQFGGESIQSLITADEYFSFALAYIAGFALLFQLPLIVLFLNRITPLKPSGMIKAQKFIILGSFIVAAILTPTPDPLNQLIMALPIVVLYQLSIVLVWFLNRKKPDLYPSQQVSGNVQIEKLDEDTVVSRQSIRQPGNIKLPQKSATALHSPRMQVMDISAPTHRTKRPRPKVLASATESSKPETNDFQRVLSRGRPVKLIDITVG